MIGSLRNIIISSQIYKSLNFQDFHVSLGRNDIALTLNSFPRVQSIKLVCTFLVTHSFGIHPSFALGEILLHSTGNLQILESNLLILIPEREKLKEAFCSARKEDLHSDVYIHSSPFNVTFMRHPPKFSKKREEKIEVGLFSSNFMSHGSGVGCRIYST